jgi:transcriptional regulator with XRE-family HTH domain
MRTRDVTVIQKRFGAHVRDRRKLRGLSRETLALSCKFGRTYIGGIERGERNISLLNIYTIAAALDVPVKDLFSD